MCGVNISGVTKSNRCFLGSVQYNLSLILRLFNVSKKDIYLSLKNLRSLDSSSSLIVPTTTESKGVEIESVQGSDMDNKSAGSDTSSGSNLISSNKQIQCYLKLRIIILAMNKSLDIKHTDCASHKKIAIDLKNSINSYRSSLTELIKRVSLKSKPSKIYSNISRLEKLILNKTTTLNFHESKIKEYEEFIPRVSAYLDSLLTKSPSEIALIYNDYIIIRNKKVIDPALSLIKSDIKKNTKVRDYNYKSNTSAYYRSYRKEYSSLSTNSSGLSNGSRHIFTRACFLTVTRSIYTNSLITCTYTSPYNIYNVNKKLVFPLPSNIVNDYNPLSLEDFILIKKKKQPSPLYRLCI